MKREIIKIPDTLFKELEMTWDIDWHGQGLGESNAGIHQTIYNALPRWVGKPKVFLSGASIAQWRAIRAQAQGRLGVFKIAIVDPVGFGPAETGVAFPKGIPFSSGSFFSNGYGFNYTPQAVAANAANAGDTRMRLDMSLVGIAPKIGQIMSHNNWPFIVVSVSEVSTDIYDIWLQMPLRSAVEVNDPVLMRGVGLFEATEDHMGHAQYGASYVTTVSLSFREVLNR